MTKLERIAKILMSERARHVRILNEDRVTADTYRYRLGQKHMIDEVLRLMDDNWLEVEEQRQIVQNEYDQIEGELNESLQKTVRELYIHIEYLKKMAGEEVEFSTLLW